MMGRQNLVLFTTQWRVTKAHSKNKYMLWTNRLENFFLVYFEFSYKFSKILFTKLHSWTMFLQGEKTSNNYKVSFEPYKNILEIVMMVM